MRSAQSLVCLALLSRAAAQRECSLDPADQEQLDKYDKDVFIDPACSEVSIDPVNHCNMFGKGQNCRGCYTTCDGAIRYREDFAAEYEIVGDDLFTFCPGSEVESIEECDGSAPPTLGDRRTTPAPTDVIISALPDVPYDDDTTEEFSYPLDDDDDDEGVADRPVPGPTPPPVIRAPVEAPVFVAPDVPSAMEPEEPESFSFSFEFDDDFMAPSPVPAPTAERLPKPSAPVPPTSGDRPEAPVAAPVAAPTARDTPEAPVAAPVAAPTSGDRPEAPVAAPVAAPTSGDRPEAPVAAPVPPTSGDRPEAPVAAPVAAPTARDKPEAPVAAPVKAPTSSDRPEAPVAAPVAAPTARDKPEAPVAAPVAAPTARDKPEAPVAKPSAPVTAPVEAPVTAPTSRDQPVAAPVAEPSAPVTPPVTAPTSRDQPVAAPVVAPVAEPTAPVRPPVAAPSPVKEPRQPTKATPAPFSYQFDDDAEVCSERGVVCYDDEDCCEPYHCDNISYYCDKKDKPRPPSPVPSPIFVEDDDEGVGSFSFSFSFDLDVDDDWWSTDSFWDTWVPAPSPTDRDAPPVGEPDLSFDFEPDADKRPTTRPRSEEDCRDRLTDSMKNYLDRTDKGVFYYEDCRGSHCNMFGLGNDCRGCYNDCATCETFLWEADASPDDDYASHVYMCPAEFPLINGKVQSFSEACGSRRRRLRGFRSY